jgi:hypothetical protein
MRRRRLMAFSHPASRQPGPSTFGQARISEAARLQVARHLGSIPAIG